MGKMCIRDRVIGAHDIPVMADYLFEEADFSCVDALILPGGIPGSNHLNAHAHLKELVKEKTEEGVLIGAICAGPMVLGLSLIHILYHCEEPEMGIAVHP